LNKEVKDTKEARDDRRRELADAEGELDKLVRQADDALLSSLDSRVLTLLDEVIQLQDRGLLERAQEKLDEAARIWREEEARRAKSRYDQIRKQIGDAARSTGEPPPGR
jgi:hypothetical protein